MKQAVLYVCHGSRVKEACDEAIAFIERTQKHIHADIQEICFLELAEPSIEEGFASCIKQGATNVAVVPLLLLTAVHAKEDIPLEVKKAAENYPEVAVTYGLPIGVHQKMAGSIMNRIYEQGRPDAESIIVLIGRGSSDPDVVRDLTAISELVKSEAGVSKVEICFLTAAKPSFDEMLSNLSLLKEKTVFLVPYLLFTGLLMREIQTKADKLDHKKIRVCRYLGYDSEVEQVFAERVKSAINNHDSKYTFTYGETSDAAING
ncbi:sirohydrochlorin chelatase [Metabacillus idriensis]|uniref:sirohydrochlorin chelatase n=1 Tax=Metabacillus idriensis TaxID=324768 RepID=UPI003D29CEB1